MLTYQIRLAWKSLRRNPFLSLLTVLGIGLGIAVSMTFVTSYYVLAGNPIPAKSEKLFYVQLDNWNPQRPYDDDKPDEPPDQLTYRDATGLMESRIPAFQSAHFKAELTVHPEKAELRPFREVVRMCSGDFFRMFDVPFAFGAPWAKEADAAGEQVVVLGSAMNQKLFGGADSVGRRLRIEDRDFRVVGVLAPWHPLPKFYDTLNDATEEAEQMFMPFALTPALEVRSAGNTSCWGDFTTDFAKFLTSECIWIQMWVELDNERQKADYLAFLDAYTEEQRKSGRFGRPNHNKLRDVMAWLRFADVVPQKTRSMFVISLLFLLVCSVNLIGILLGKFLARAPEVGVRRALGASRRWVFAQHLVECGMVGVLGGLIGLVVAWFNLRLMDRLFESRYEFQLDVRLFLIALGLALLSALVAGAYPAWRICRTQPALCLKTQ